MCQSLLWHAPIFPHFLNFLPLPHEHRSLGFCFLDVVDFDLTAAVEAAPEGSGSLPFGISGGGGISAGTT